MDKNAFHDLKKTAQASDTISLVSKFSDRSSEMTYLTAISSNANEK